MANSDNKLNIGDAWKDIANMQLNVGDDWKDIVAMQINIGDVWKDFWAEAGGGEWFGTATDPLFNTDSQTSAGYSYAGDWASTVGGSITKIQIYVSVAGTYDFAVWTKSGSTFTDTAWTQGHVLGTGLTTLEAPGDFTAMDIAIGQYIGHWSSSGRTERHGSGGAGYWYDNSDQIGDGSGSTFTESATARDIQLRVWIE